MFLCLDLVICGEFGGKITLGAFLGLCQVVYRCFLLPWGRFYLRMQFAYGVVVCAVVGVISEVVDLALWVEMLLLLPQLKLLQMVRVLFAPSANAFTANTGGIFTSCGFFVQ